MTRLRKEEAACLTWPNVDLRAKTLTVNDTKNHLDHTLPLSDFLFDMLQRRKLDAVNEYVFPVANGVGRITEQRKQMDRVTEASDVSFTIHDLRRTFITIAESLDIPAYALKRLLNHKMNNDVTAGYIISDVDAIKEVFDRASGAITFGHDGGGFFIFPDQSGFWFAVHPGQGSPPPF